MTRILPLFLSILLLFLSPEAANGQIHLDKNPPSFDFPDLSEEIDTKSFEAVDLARLRMEDEMSKNGGDAPRFGEKHIVDLGLKNSGTWTQLEDGSKIWRLKIKAKAARSINLSYSRFWLPAGAEFFVYSSDHSQVLGAFTERNNKGFAGFATGLVLSEEVILEYYEPAKVAGKGKITISEIIQGYADVQNLYRVFGDAGSCNEDIGCPGNEHWAGVEKSVAMVLVDGNRVCSGTLISNTNHDCTPYFLTANHCLGDLDAEANNNAANWCFMFNYNSPDCDGADGPVNHTVCGAMVKANNATSDFALLELLEDPTEYDVVFAGWDRSGEVESEVTCIHHPRGDVKKISYEDDLLLSSNFGGAVPDTHWRVQDWESGTTEGGSSGSGLFNKEQLLIGQLHGGSATCISGESVGSDSFGKFSYSWDAGNSATRRLADWLDPIQSGAISNSTWDCSKPEPTAIWNCSNRVSCTGGQISFFDYSTNEPGSWLWHFEGGSPTYSTEQNPTVTFDDAGSFSVSLTVANSEGTNQKQLESYIVIEEALMAPMVESVDGSTTILNIVNPDEDSCIWLQETDVACADGAFVIDNYNVTYNNVGTEDLLEMTVDLSELSSPYLNFDVAYARYSAGFKDALEVRVRRCGEAAQRLYYKEGSDLATVADMPAPFSPSSCDDWRTEEIDLSAFEGEKIVISFVNHGGWGNWMYLDNFEVFGNNLVQLTCRTAVFLEGPYESGSMQSSSFLQSILPYYQPYGTQPWGYFGADNLGNFPSHLIDQIVDWVLLEIRDAADQDQLIARRAALLLSDGRILNTNGSPDVHFGTHMSGAYYLVIRHRNHLDIMSKETLAMPSDQLYDFRSNGTSAQSGSLKVASDGKRIMRAGDFDGNGVINFVDFNRYMNSSSMIMEYKGMDANLDGLGSVEDFNLYRSNSNKMANPSLRY